jgi:hypothetical protein
LIAVAKRTTQDAFGEVGAAGIASAEDEDGGLHKMAGWKLAIFS